MNLAFPYGKHPEYVEAPSHSTFLCLCTGNDGCLGLFSGVTRRRWSSLPVVLAIGLGPGLSPLMLILLEKSYLCNLRRINALQVPAIKNSKKRSAEINLSSVYRQKFIGANTFKWQIL